MNIPNRSRSAALFARAQAVIPGGVNSPVRAFRSVGGDPLFIERGEGAYLFDVDGNRYLDLVGSWGPLIFGHADPAILSAIADAASRGTTFGASTEAEVIFAGGDLRRRAGNGKGAPRVVRHGSGDVVFAGCSRVYRQNKNRQVRGMLSRT